ncbi:MAG: hypothetical protein J6R89_03210, partial [Clostridia bacterium]|nr:hypothetical protein [Clostridia bacterium]
HSAPLLSTLFGRQRAIFTVKPYYFNYNKRLKKKQEQKRASLMPKRAFCQNKSRPRRNEGDLSLLQR